MSLFDSSYNSFSTLSDSTLTSVSLLDAVAIPSSMVFSRLLLRRFYKVTHFLGAAVCIAGVIVNVFVDYENEGHDYIQEDDAAKAFIVLDRGHRTVPQLYYGRMNINRGVNTEDFTQSILEQYIGHLDEIK